ncbi:MAG: hypothetical protein E7D27_04050 [Clostridium celatum]|nr:hypothetical protein [Clostridium celatum]
MEIRFATMKDIDTHNKLGYIAVGGFSPVGEPYEIMLSKVL